ncbi:hypothetical protein ACFPL7_02040 [Dongia soli]|uniref:Uncharacterized protein n=1 Tax=Dongia soli TaxID=600628 RepID=A0ABU5EHD2_9PROT|nr:hypothetical protein [Dongia soli]MDY0885292.1 hypothetical protein [Dongia soli]
MSEATKHIGRVCKLFPDWADEVLRLAMKSESFRSACEDYGIAVQALGLLTARNLAQDEKKIEEYRVLVAELEKELECELLTFRRGDEG